MRFMDGDKAVPKQGTKTMTLSKSESRQSLFALMAALPLTAAIVAVTLSFAEFVV